MLPINKATLLLGCMKQFGLTISEIPAVAAPAMKKSLTDSLVVTINKNLVIEPSKRCQYADVSVGYNYQLQYKVSTQELNYNSNIIYTFTVYFILHIFINEMNYDDRISLIIIF